MHTDHIMCQSTCNESYRLLLCRLGAVGKYCGCVYCFGEVLDNRQHVQQLGASVWIPCIRMA